MKTEWMKKMQNVSLIWVILEYHPDDLFRGCRRIVWMAIRNPVKKKKNKSRTITNLKAFFHVSDAIPKRSCHVWRATIRFVYPLVNVALFFYCELLLWRSIYLNLLSVKLMVMLNLYFFCSFYIWMNIRCSTINVRKFSNWLWKYIEFIVQYFCFLMTTFTFKIKFFIKTKNLKISEIWSVWKYYIIFFVASF